MQRGPCIRCWGDTLNNNRAEGRFWTRSNCRCRYRKLYKVQISQERFQRFSTCGEQITPNGAMPGREQRSMIMGLKWYCNRFQLQSRAASSAAELVMRLFKPGMPFIPHEKICYLRTDRHCLSLSLLILGSPIQAGMQSRSAMPCAPIIRTAQPLPKSIEIRLSPGACI